MADFTVSNHGSISLLTPVSKAADIWIHEHIALDQAQMFGSAVAIEHRYIADVVAGLQADGLSVNK